MPLTFEQSKDALAQLVKHFATNRDAYRAPAYKEAHARQEFIDPFFVALGWDVHNTQRAAPDYREVVMEDTLEIAGQKKAPDYVFRVGKERKFFVEAKKPGVDLKQDAQPAYQLRRYAWTAKLPLSILTDFEEMAVYDCRARPAPTDKASTGRLLYFTFQEYTDRWQEIWDVFSRPAVLGGSFDQYAQTSKGKRGTSTVDAEFLKEIENWRDALARNLALRDPRLNIDDLNDAVQRTIDRIIFLRMAEDRGIEDYGRLARLAEGEHIYRELVTLFRHADARYNSGLFDFSKQGDSLTPGLKVDDKTLAPILSGLYFPESPYEFSVLPVEILGNVYEQFLGRVIKLTEGHRAKVEEKPEVKKAGGVYYTPAYIVEYIVKHTVGVAVAGKTPQQLRGFRCLDPACGSGSFLLGAYQYLLDYYLNWYTTNAPEKHPKAVWQNETRGWQDETRGLSPLPTPSTPPSHSWRLTTAEKKRILLEHIFGVDIDRQAVEVTKLSLLLKVLETESDESLGRQLTLLHEEAKARALPNLDRNIKCGNSLIGPDYFTGQLMYEEDELKRVNPFDWAREFPQVMKPAARALWFVTFVTHNSRVSERMVTYGVQTGEPLIFLPEDQILIAEKIFEICRREDIVLVAANVLPDHVHLVVAAEDEKTLEEHIRKIKGASSFAFQRARGWEKGSNQHVWAQKFNRTPIADETALANILEYVNNNHLKHIERWGETLLTTWDKGLKPLVRAGCVSVEEACQPQGGFDCVIGNPPYGAELTDGARSYLYSSFVGESKSLDTYELFLLQSKRVLKSNGRISMIIPSSWLTGEKYELSRRKLITELYPVIAYALPFDIFADAYIDTAIVVLTSEPTENCLIHFFAKRERLTYIPDIGTQVAVVAIRQDNQTRLSIVLSQRSSPVLQKVNAPSVKFGDWFEISRGVQPYARSKHTEEQIKKRFLHATSPKSKQYLPELQGNELSRYFIDPERKSYLKYSDDIASTRPPKMFEGKRIVLRRLLTRKFRLQASLAQETMITTDNVLNMIPRANEANTEFALAVLNSKLISWVYVNTSMIAQKDDFPQVHISALSAIRLPEYTKLQFNNMAKLVEQMLDLHQHLAASQNASERERLQRLIDSTDQQIDTLVYELYGLTPEEIAIVEHKQGA